MSFSRIETPFSNQGSATLAVAAAGIKYRFYGGVFSPDGASAEFSLLNNGTALLGGAANGVTIETTLVIPFNPDGYGDTAANASLVLVLQSGTLNGILWYGREIVV